MYKLLDRIKAGIIEIVKSRAFVLIIVFCITSAILVQRMFTLQIVKGQEYLEDYTLKIQKTREVQGTRGRLLDRNGVVLADNKLAYSVTIEDNGDYSSTKEKNEIINDTLTTVIGIVESNGDAVISNFKVVVGESGEYEYTVDGTQRLRFLADVFGHTTIDQLEKDEKDLSAEGLIHYLCTDEKNGFGIQEDQLSKEEVLKRVNIRYAMWLNRFQKYVPTTIASDVSEETQAAIMENLDAIQGVNIAEDSIRVYNDSKYFANILGYTGQISQEEYDALEDEEKKKYSITDIIGKSGLEQTLDRELQGTKGEVKFYVNNVGKVIETVEGKEASAGNDVYLTIDANLQKAAYDLLEEKIAGIVLANMQNVMNYDRSTLKEGSDAIIPVDDVYHSFFQNEILDTGHFEAEDAGEAEKAVYAAFLARKEEILNEVLGELNNPNAAAYEDCTKEMQAYMSYIVRDLLTNAAAILQKDKIDTEDSTYIAWNTDETISLYTYLNYAISQNWIDTSKLSSYMGEESSYSDMNEIYAALVNYIGQALAKSNGFDKVIYRYMIKTQRISGTQVCLMLYEQGILEYDETQYDNLVRGAVNPYDFIRGKIQTLELTPGQLGLEPCTGSCVVVDPNSGDVLACVSYPGYDNNRLANSMDAKYYSQLQSNDSVAPLYNNATQEKTAPGSTYKPLVAAAGLTEGVIDTGTILSCSGEYKKITPSPKCWVYPNAHGSLNVSGAIQNSCNNFFYEVGYRLGLSSTDMNDETTYSSDRGLKTLEEYASMFGLNETSGIEIPESSPQISDSDSVRSAIGQGRNSFTTVQLARYVAAVANRGTVYDLTLIDKVTDKDGNTTQETEPVVRNQIDNISYSTWNAVHAGMRAVVSESNTYNALGEFEMSGKTGTAQQSTSHADHGLFVGYAPSSSPEISFAIRIANGYASLYPAEVGRDLVRYYYNLASREELITGNAAAVTASTTHGD